MKLVARPATENDYEFAFQAKKAALGPYIVARWGWNEEYQRSVHHQRWTEKPWFIIQLGAKLIGTMSVLENPISVRFGEFYLMPEYQGRGLGTMLLSDVLTRCDQANQEVRLEHLKWNPVGSLYKRNGFTVVSENDIHYYLVRKPLPPIPTCK
jgi:GNAT superfamily N-acetyltransferase